MAYGLCPAPLPGRYRVAGLPQPVLLHPRQALATMVGALYSNQLIVAIMRPLLWLLAPAMLGKTVKTDVYRNDILIEAKAEVAHDGRESLKRIAKPTLIQGGEFDKYFPLEYLRETQALIPNGNGTLIIGNPTPLDPKLLKGGAG